jgi:hypothetical protein
MHPLGPLLLVRIYPNVAFLYIQMLHIAPAIYASISSWAGTFMVRKFHLLF